MTLLSETDLRRILGIKSHRTWARRRPDMVKAGLKLFKLYPQALEYMIHEEDLHAYLEEREKVARRNFMVSVP